MRGVFMKQSTKLTASILAIIMVLGLVIPSTALYAGAYDIPALITAEEKHIGATALLSPPAIEWGNPPPEGFNSWQEVNPGTGSERSGALPTPQKYIDYWNAYWEIHRELVEMEHATGSLIAAPHDAQATARNLNQQEFHLPDDLVLASLSMDERSDLLNLFYEFIRAMYVKEGLVAEDRYGEPRESLPLMIEISPRFEGGNPDNVAINLFLVDASEENISWFRENVFDSPHLHFVCLDQHPRVVFSRLLFYFLSVNSWLVEDPTVPVEHFETVLDPAVGRQVLYVSLTEHTREQEDKFREQFGDSPYLRFTPAIINPEDSYPVFTLPPVHTVMELSFFSRIAWYASLYHPSPYFPASHPLLDGSFAGVNSWYWGKKESGEIYRPTNAVIILLPDNCEETFQRFRDEVMDSPLLYLTYPGGLDDLLSYLEAKESGPPAAPEFHLPDDLASLSVDERERISRDFNSFMSDKFYEGGFHFHENELYERPSAWIAPRFGGGDLDDIVLNLFFDRPSEEQMRWFRQNIFDSPHLHFASVREMPNIMRFEALPYFLGMGRHPSVLIEWGALVFEEAVDRDVLYVSLLNYSEEQKDSFRREIADSPYLRFVPAVINRDGSYPTFMLPPDYTVMDLRFIHSLIEDRTLMSGVVPNPFQLHPLLDRDFAMINSGLLVAQSRGEKYRPTDAVVMILPENCEETFQRFRDEVLDSPLLYLTCPDGLDELLLYLEAKESAAPFIPGDINGDGVVDDTDVLLLRLYLAGQSVDIFNNTSTRRAADVNGDGRIDGVDLLLLRLIVAGVD
jgi:hypothetical protein